MTKYVNIVTIRLEKFMAWRLKHVSRDSNRKADTLAIVATSLLLARVVNHYQPSKRNRRSMSFLDDSNSPLFELGRTTR